MLRVLTLGQYLIECRRPLGPAAPELANLLKQADVLVNLTGATVLRDEHLAVPIRIYLETDPVLPQLEVRRVLKP